MPTFDANADYLRLSSGLFDYNSGYTIMCWAYPVSNPAAQITLFSVANNGSNLDRLRSNSGGTSWAAQSIVGGTSINTNGSSVSYASWQHWAMVRRDASNLDTYLNGVLDATATQSVSGRAAAAQLDIGNTNSANAYFNGRVFAIKIWNVALSAAEIAQEMRTIRPVKLANLWAWYPGRPGSGERAKDYSGNGRNLTEGGTLTDDDPPPISWGGRIGRRFRAAATTYNQAVAGTLTSSGALTRQTGKTLAGTLTSAGALVRRTTKVLAGTLTSAGALIKQAHKVFGGTLTSSGALTAARVFLKAIGGTLTSSGALVKTTTKTLAGTLTSSGAVIKRTTKGLAGTLTSSGALTGVRVFLKAVGGTLTSSGALVKTTTKTLSGTLSSSGALVRRTTKILAGTLSTAGALVKQTRKSIGGTLTSAGALTISRLLAWLRHIFAIPAPDYTTTTTLGASFSVPAEDRSSTTTLGASLTVASEEYSSDA